MYLSKRLEVVASFVHEGGRIADIGTDHGYIPIFLVREKKVVSAIAMDVRKGPLERAREHVREYGLEDLIELRLSDGLEHLHSGEADTVVIAGMGGELMIRIMNQGRHMWESVSQWVLSPQSEIAEVRRFLVEQGFEIEKETMVKEDGKFYTIMSACPQKDAFTSQGKEDVMQEQSTQREQKLPYIVEELYGKQLLEEKHPVLKEFLKREKIVKQSILKGLEGNLNESAKKRREELEWELEKNQEAMQYFG